MIAAARRAAQCRFCRRANGSSKVEKRGLEPAAASARSDETISLDREAGLKQIAGMNALDQGGRLIKRGAVQAMPRSDQETVLQALEHARRIVGRCIAGQSDATRTVERLLTVLDEVEVADALDRMSRRRILRF